MTENTRLTTFGITSYFWQSTKPLSIHSLEKKNSGFDYYSGGQIMTTMLFDGIRNGLFL
jgi:hypothetical protein